MTIIPTNIIWDSPSRSFQPLWTTPTILLVPVGGGYLELKTVDAFEMSELARFRARSTSLSAAIISLILSCNVVAIERLPI